MRLDNLTIAIGLSITLISQVAFNQRTEESKVFHSITEGLTAPEEVEFLEITNLQDVDSLGLLKLFPRLHSLSLIDYHFATAPEVIADISSLRELKFINDDFYIVPNSYAKLRNLQRLEFIHDTHLNVQSALTLANKLPALSELKIEGLTGPVFPENIVFPSQLKLLSLRNNQLNHLPNSIAAIKNLQILDVGNNELLEVPDFLIRLNKLNTIYLDHQPYLRLDHTFKVLQKIPRLKLVHFEGNNLKWEKIQPYLEKSLFKILLGDMNEDQSLVYKQELKLYLPDMPKFSNNPEHFSFKINFNH